MWIVEAIGCPGLATGHKTTEPAHGGYCSDDPIQWKRCSRRCATGAITRPAATMKTSPEYSAYEPANTLPASVLGTSTGPIPPRIIDALRNASVQFRCSKPA